jgi:hypothetical protein
MKWTVEHPSREGWYWYRERNMRTEVVHVCLSRDKTRLEVKSVDGHRTAPMDACGWEREWCGPIQPPK